MRFYSMRVCWMSAVLFLISSGSVASSCSEKSSGGGNPTGPSEAAEQRQARPKPTAKAPGKPLAKPLAVAPGPVVQDSAFELRAVTLPAYKVGQKSTLEITLSPKGAFHVNEEYPLRVAFNGADKLGLAKANLEKGDATEFTKTKARFVVPFEPTAAGEHKVSAKVSFAVCTEENCVPDERTLAFAVAVQ